MRPANFFLLLSRFLPQTAISFKESFDQTMHSVSFLEPLYLKIESSSFPGCRPPVVPYVSIMMPVICSPWVAGQSTSRLVGVINEQSMAGIGSCGLRTNFSLLFAYACKFRMAYTEEHQHPLDDREHKL